MGLLTRPGPCEHRFCTTSSILQTSDRRYSFFHTFLFQYRFFESVLYPNMSDSIFLILSTLSFCRSCSIFSSKYLGHEVWQCGCRSLQSLQHLILILHFLHNIHQNIAILWIRRVSVTDSSKACSDCIFVCCGEISCNRHNTVLWR